MMNYQLEHFMLFSPDVFFRLMDTYINQYFFIAVAFNVALLLCLLPSLRQYTIRLSLLICSLAWVWLGWRFYIIEYASINGFARYLGAACLMMSPWWLYLSAVLANHAEKQDRTLLWLTLGYVIFLRPLVIGALHGNWVISGIGLLPVPTLLIALGTLLSVKFAFRWVLVTFVLALLTLETLTLFMLDMIIWQEALVAVVLMMMLMAQRQSGVKRIRTGLS